ncbi:MAG: glycosyltransferase family 39 protein [Planctomycetes bacterium]|nr:glycosyltransferase family 39 protein [Planctomycetota bacterium]
MRSIFRWSFGLRFGTGMIAWFLTVFFGFSFLEDALAYENIAGMVAQDWSEGKQSAWLEREMTTGGKEPWALITLFAVLYFFTGGIQLLPLVIAFYCLITAWTPVLTYRITRQLGGSPRAARISGWLVTLSPAFAFWSGALYKEGLILLVLNFAVYHGLRLQGKWRWQSLLFLGLCLGALCGLRFYLVAFLGPALILGLLLGRKQPNAGPTGSWVLLRQIMLVSILLGIGMGLGFTDRLQQSIPLDLQEGLTQIETSRRDLATYQSGYLPDVRITTPEEALAFLPVGLAYFLTVPLPWHWGALRQNLAIPDTLFWVLLYPVILVGIRRAWSRNFRGTVPLIAFTVAISCFYALFIGNIGTAYRERIQVWLLWAPFAGMGWDFLRPPQRAAFPPPARRGGYVRP